MKHVILNLFNQYQKINHFTEQPNTGAHNHGDIRVLSVGDATRSLSFDITL